MREEVAQTKAYVRQFLLENRYRCYVGPLVFYFVADLITGFLPMTENFDGGKIRTVVDGKKVFTPMIIVFITIGVTD